MLEALSAFKGMDLAATLLFLLAMVLIRLVFSMKSQISDALIETAKSHLVLANRLRQLAREIKRRKTKNVKSSDNGVQREFGSVTQKLQR